MVRNGLRGAAAALLLMGLPVVAPGLGSGPASAQEQAESACSRWNAADEQDFSAADKSKVNLTATACGSNADDSTAIGVQCPGKPQIRYYPEGDLPPGISARSRVSMAFAVGDEAVAKTMRYDALNGVFFAPISASDPLLGLLVSGGPLDVTSDSFGTHRFRLVGSTAAIGAVFAACNVKAAVLTPLPRPRPDDGE